MASEAAERLEDLRIRARYARERYDLYKAKSYGPRETSPARLRELERESEAATARLRAAEAEAAAQAQAASSARMTQLDADVPPSTERN